jgi:phage-related protein
VAAEGFKIADGYLDIEADTSSADREVDDFMRESKVKLAALEKAWSRSGSEAGGQYGRNVSTSSEREIVNGLWKDINGRWHNAITGRFARIGDDSGRSFASRLGRRARRDVERDLGGFFGSLGRVLGNGFQALGRAAGAAFSSLTSFGSKIGEIGSKIGEIGSKIGDVAGGFMSFAKIALITMAIPAVVGLAAALSNLWALVLLLPGAIAGLAATIAPLIVAFHGFGEAIGAGFSGDAAKFKEALKGLAEPAQKVVKEIVGLKKVLTELRMGVQTAFFAPLIGQIKPLATSLFPTLRAGMEDVADALGNMVGGILALFREGDLLKDILDIFRTAGKVVRTLTAPLTHLFGTMFGVIDHSLPFIERIFAALGRGLDHLASFLDDSMRTGKFEKWLEKAFTTAKDLFGLLAAFGDMFSAILGNEDAQKNGEGFLRSLTKHFQDMATFFRSDDGKKFLKNLTDSLQQIGYLVEHMVVLFGAMARGLNGFVAFIDGIGPALSAFWGWVTAIASAISGGFMTGVHAVADFFVMLGTTIWGFITSAGQAIAGWFMSVVGWFEALPGRIWAAISAVPGLIASAWTAIFDAFFTGIGYVTGLILMFVTHIPELLSSMWQWIENRFMDGVHAIAGFLNALPGIASNFFGALYNTITSYVSSTYHSIVSWLSGIGPAIGRWFSDAWSRAKSSTSDGVNSVMSYIHDLPGRVIGALKGAGSWLYGVGQDMIRGLISGITSMIGAAINTIKRAVGDIIGGAKHAADAHSPSRRMAREVGRWLPPGIEMGIRAEMPALQRYMQGAMNSLMQTAPQVNVAGAQVAVGAPRVVVMLDGKEISAKLDIDPARVAAAAAEGNRRRAFVNTGRPVSAAA